LRANLIETWQVYEPFRAFYSRTIGRECQPAFLPPKISIALSITRSRCSLATGSSASTTVTTAVLSVGTSVTAIATRGGRIGSGIAIGFGPGDFLQVRALCP